MSCTLGVDLNDCVLCQRLIPHLIIRINNSLPSASGVRTDSTFFYCLPVLLTSRPDPNLPLFWSWTCTYDLLYAKSLSCFFFFAFRLTSHETIHAKSAINQLIDSQSIGLLSTDVMCRLWSEIERCIPAAELVQQWFDRLRDCKTGDKKRGFLVRSMRHTEQEEKRRRRTG